jgi:hypothetical protein
MNSIYAKWKWCVVTAGLKQLGYKYVIYLLSIGEQKLDWDLISNMKLN